jgi:hypothetical protein
MRLGHLPRDRGGTFKNVDALNGKRLTFTGNKGG